MTEEEAIIKMREPIEKDNLDNEWIHINADEVLVEFLKTNGFRKIADAYEDVQNDIDFWYA